VPAGFWLHPFVRRTIGIQPVTIKPSQEHGLVVLHSSFANTVVQTRCVLGLRSKNGFVVHMPQEVARVDVTTCHLAEFLFHFLFVALTGEIVLLVFVLHLVHLVVRIVFGFVDRVKEEQE
jgi:hypothetical protein